MSWVPLYGSRVFNTTYVASATVRVKYKDKYRINLVPFARVWICCFFQLARDDCSFDKFLHIYLSKWLVFTSRLFYLHNFNLFYAHFHFFLHWTIYLKLKLASSFQKCFLSILCLLAILHRYFTLYYL